MPARGRRPSVFSTIVRFWLVPGVIRRPVRIMLAMSAPSPSYRAIVAALALGQVVNWAALYYGFSSFVLPMQAELPF